MLSEKEVVALRGLTAAQELAHETAVNAGWYVDLATGMPKERNVAEVIALMHSELSESLEAYRKGLCDDKLPHRSGLEVEWADTFIRIADTNAAHGGRMPEAVVALSHLIRAYPIQEIRMALAVFRMLAEAGALGLDLAGAIVEKNRFNVNRADHKLAARMAPGGKKI